MLQDPTPARQAAWQAVASFKGAPGEFWSLLVQAVAQATAGELSVLYLREVGAGGGESWRAIANWPAVGGGKVPPLAASVPAPLLLQARTGGVASGAVVGGRWQVGLMGFTANGGAHELVLAVHLGAAALSEHEARACIATFLGLPALYEAGRLLRVGERDAARLAQTLEIIGRVQEGTAFEQAALALVNDLAQGFGAETVSLSWRASEGLRLRATSHAERIDRRTELSALLEEAQQEALSQQCELAWPGEASQPVIVRAHARYAQLQAPGHLLTLPLAVQMDTDAAASVRGCGALTLERQRAAFTPAEQWALRLIGDLALPALQRLEERARPLPRRLGTELWRSLPAMLKPDTAPGRRLALGLTLAVALVMLVPLPYQVDAGAVVKADVMAFVGAPFDGYIESSPARLGSVVQAGDVLFTLATRELVLDRASLLAEIAQHTREAEKRRSANQLPEMQIAEAQAAQSAARLQQVEYRLAQAQVRAPIAGVLVEGEPGKSLGGAVRRGDTTVKIAALQALHVEAAVPERSMSDVRPGQPVQVKLLAMPDQTVPMRLMRVIPAAAVKDGSNTFPVRLEVDGALPAAWRPGMSGVAKIDQGWRPLAWIASHRVLDYLRLTFWW
jgi:multidrug resistance efflux pump